MGWPGFSSSCFTSSYVVELAIHLFEIDVFDMDVSVIKSLMPGIYTTVGFE